MSVGEGSGGQAGQDNVGEQLIDPGQQAKGQVGRLARSQDNVGGQLTDQGGAAGEGSGGQAGQENVSVEWQLTDQGGSAGEGSGGQAGQDNVNQPVGWQLIDQCNQISLHGGPGGDSCL